MKRWTLPVAAVFVALADKCAVHAKETYALEETQKEERKNLKGYSDTICLTKLDDLNEVCIFHYVQVLLGYKIEQDYEQTATSPDQRYYSF